MKKTIISSLILLLIAFSLYRCLGSTENKEGIVYNTVQKDSIFAATIKALNGSDYFKEVKFVNDSVNLIYFQNYSEFKRHKPESNSSKETFDTFWTEKTVKKNIISAVGKIFEKNSFIHAVGVEKLYNGKSYKILVTRNRLAQFEYALSAKANLNLGNTFSDKYVYNEEGRELFYSYFIK